MASTGKRTKGKCSFNSELAKEFPHIEKRPHHGDSIGGVYCKICSKTFSISNGGRSNITTHNNSVNHKKLVLASASSKSVTNFYRPKTASSSDLELAAKEGVFAYHTILHDQSFRSLDCTSKLIKATFQQKFSCARTKCEAIVVNVLYPNELNELRKDLENIDFVSVSVDCSNHKAIKLMPVVIRYFSNSEGVKVKVIQIHSLTSETSDHMTEKILESLGKFELMKKVVSFCGDNANVNFGGQQRAGKNNVYYKLKSAVKQNIIGVGCISHVIHNSVRAATDMIPYDFESILRKIYNHFSVYTLRTESLREFCDFVSVEFKVLLSTCKTRWLSLGPALERVLTLFEALKSYFLSTNTCPVLTRFFSDPCAELYMWFLQSQLHVFSQTILKTEKQSVSAVETAGIFQDLLSSLELRNSENFIGLKTKQVLRKLVEEGEITEQKFNSDVCNFFQTCINYMKNWGYPLDEVKCFSWIALLKELEWSVIETSLGLLNDKGVIVNDSILFEEFACVQRYVTAEVIEKWNSNVTPIDKRWTELFGHFSKQNISYVNFSKVIAFALSLPGSNASVERVFSLVNNYWTEEKSKLTVETLQAVLVMKINVKEDCVSFYEKLKQNPALLQKIHSSDKYTY